MLIRKASSHLCWNPVGRNAVGNIVYDYCASSYHRARTNPHSVFDRCPDSHPRSLCHLHSAAQAHTRTHVDSILNYALMTNTCAGVDDHIAADLRARTHDGSGCNDGTFPYGNVTGNCSLGVNSGGELEALCTDQVGQPQACLTIPEAEDQVTDTLPLKKIQLLLAAQDLCSAKVRIAACRIDIVKEPHNVELTTQPHNVGNH